MPEFIKGRELSRRFYHETIRPILKTHFPNVPHGAARIGGGSDVLGFDTAMSMDHDWGPRVKLFLRNVDKHLAEEIQQTLAHELPFEFLGFPVNFTRHDDGSLNMQLTDIKPQTIQVPVLTVADFIQSQFDHNLNEPFTVVDWLTLSSQTFAEVAYAWVHVDEVGELIAIQEQFAWYPHDVWLYLLASSWERIGQEEHLMPRSGFVGDELGSAVIGGRLVRDIMFLCFLMERRYASYPKWFGTAFQQLKCAPQLTPILREIQQAVTWSARAEAICQAYTYIAKMHNALNLTAPLPIEPTAFYGRPFRIIHGDEFTEALVAEITDPEVKRIADMGMIGSVDHFSDSTNLRSHIAWRKRLKQIYEDKKSASRKSTLV